MNFPERYEAAIAWIVSLCPQPDKFAHVFAGLALWLGAAIVLRRPLRSPINFAVIVVFEIANECIDRMAHGAWLWRDTIRDAGATWFWPFVLMIALQRSRKLRG